MIPWKEIDRVKVPGQDGDIALLKRGEEFSIRTAGAELMNSRIHGSEELLAEFTCSRIKTKSNVQILVGGLGMGYTLAAALDKSAPDTDITVAELIPAVVKWNIEHLGHLAGKPMDDPRVSAIQKDVVDIIRSKKQRWDAILLDVDNGPEGLSRKENNRLYSQSGIKMSYQALCPGGILAIWSSSEDYAFTHRLKKCGFQVQIKNVRARKSGKGSRHTIWLAVKF